MLIIKPKRESRLVRDLRQPEFHARIKGKRSKTCHVEWMSTLANHLQEAKVLAISPRGIFLQHTYKESSHLQETDNWGRFRRIAHGRSRTLRPPEHPISMMRRRSRTWFSPSWLVCSGVDCVLLWSCSQVYVCMYVEYVLFAATRPAEPGFCRLHYEADLIINLLAFKLWLTSQLLNDYTN